MYKIKGGRILINFLKKIPNYRKKSFKEKMHESMLYEYFENPHIRGKSSILFGEQGCGKSTAICRICEKYHAQSDITLWRLRSNDNIHRIKDFEKKCVFWFATTDDFDISLVKDSDVVDIKKSLDIRYYKTVFDLMENLVPNKINAVMPPAKFFFSNDVGLPELIAKKERNEKSYKATRDYLKNYDQKSAYLWFEILYYLVNLKMTNERITMIWDEADEILEAQPKGTDWTILAWGKDIFNDVRKSNINVVLVTHQTGDINYLYRDNCSYRIFMKGSRPMKDAVIDMAPKYRFIGLLDNRSSFTNMIFHPYPIERMACDLKIRTRDDGGGAHKRVIYMEKKEYKGKKEPITVFSKWMAELTPEEKRSAELTENEYKAAEHMVDPHNIIDDEKPENPKIENPKNSRIEKPKSKKPENPKQTVLNNKNQTTQKKPLKRKIVLKKQIGGIF